MVDESIPWAVDKFRDFLTYLRNPCGKREGMDMVKILCYTVKHERGMAVEELLDKLRRDRWLTTRE